MKKYIYLLPLIFSLCFSTKALAGFDEDLNALLKTAKTGYAGIEGKFLQQTPNGSKVYESTMPLAGFVPKIMVDAQGGAIVIASAYGSEAQMNVNMLVMLPPDGYAFEKHDSDIDKTVNRPQGVTRTVAYISRTQHVMIAVYFQPNDYYTITISQFK